MKRIVELFSNKYFLVSICFVAWMLFFDRNDLLSQYEYRSQLNKFKNEKAFYIAEIEKVKTDLDELSTNRERLEKFAREKYLMKKDDEDVYVIIREKSETD
ncbi:septum formation initiator family protein [Paradesertivirga mongoliensis]|uniref:Septum formation initiator family protein n=1 Tax=Paradesertivirga mongoliensis TaxID=2100740 RepID=A0ABW4ZGH7_9SPHI|nr:septum formation initiator family protein [Pedobacter mongoliensis]